LAGKPDTHCPTPSRNCITVNATLDTACAAEVAPATGRVAAFLSVLENESGYDEDYMLDVITKLEALCVA
jgi:hypothetical protein